MTKHEFRIHHAHAAYPGGTADDLWRPGFRGTGKVLEIGGADQGLEVADRRTALRIHEKVAAAVAELAAALDRS